MNISPYFYGSFSNHEAKGDRKLLLKKREIRHLEAAAKDVGFTIVPILIFIDEHGRAKMDICLLYTSQALELEVFAEGALLLYILQETEVVRAIIELKL